MRHRLGIALLFAALSAAAEAADAAAEEPGPYVIRSVDFQSQGRTRDFVLMAIIDPYRKMIGSSFPDRASLDAFVADKTRLLSSRRVLASATPSYRLEPAQGGGFDVALRFATVDSMNVIGLPYGTYDSNSGLLLSLRGRDYDFLGSAQPLELNLNYQKSPSGVDSYGGQLDFVAPFQAWGAVWDFGFSEAGQFWTDGTGSSITSASMTYNLPSLGIPASVTVTQGFSYDAASPATDVDTWFLEESASATGKIPLTGSLGSWLGVDLGPLNIRPRARAGLFLEARLDPPILRQRHGPERLRYDDRPGPAEYPGVLRAGWVPERGLQRARLRPDRLGREHAAGPRPLRHEPGGL